LQATSTRKQVLHAREPGCGGILEAIDHFGLVDRDDPHRRSTPRSKAGKARLVMVYHRLPYEEVMREGRIHFQPPHSPNGIIPSLLSFFAGKDNADNDKAAAGNDTGAAANTAAAGNDLAAES